MQCPNCGSYGVDSGDLDYALCLTCGYNWTPSSEPDWNGEVYPRKASTPAPLWEPPRFRPTEPEEADDPDEEYLSSDEEDLFSDGDDEHDEWDEDEGDEEDSDDWEDDDWVDAGDFWYDDEDD